jgi:uncharacterized membrane protein
MAAAPDPPQWGPRPEPAHAAPKTRKPRRVFPWIFLAVQIAFLLWAILGTRTGAGTPKACRGLTGQELQNCKDASHVGTTLGVGVVIGLWAAADIILGITYFVFRLSRRREPS